MMKTNSCPYCGHEVQEGDTWGEITHMQEHHPDIIQQRLLDAGIDPEAPGFGMHAVPLLQTVAEAIANALVKRGMRLSEHMPGDERIEFYEGIAREVLEALATYGRERL